MKFGSSSHVMLCLSQFVHEVFQGYIVFWSSLKDKLQNSLVSYFKTRFFTLLIKVEMVDQTETFDLNEHIGCSHGNRSQKQP
jgi:hypothetical protein